VRSEHPHDIHLAKCESICELRAQVTRQICHFLERLYWPFIKPLCDLAGAVRGLAKFVKLLLKLVKQERSHLNLVGSGHRKAYRTAELASNFPGVFRSHDQTRCRSCCLVFWQIALLIFACASPFSPESSTLAPAEPRLALHILHFTQETSDVISSDVAI
jgi:hypothetical protein